MTISYAHLLANRIREHRADVWLINTGWTGGPFGVGSRFQLEYTRAILDAIHTGDLSTAPTANDPVFNLEVVTRCPGVPTELLIPKNTWEDKTGFDNTACRLAGLFSENFCRYADRVREEVCAAGPQSAAPLRSGVAQFPAGITGSTTCEA